MKKFISFAIVFVAFAVAASESVTVTGARQRWPWNGIVDVDFTLSGLVGQKYRVELNATAAAGTNKYAASTFLTEPVVASGDNRVSWDFGRDFPGVRAGDLSVTVTVHPIDMVDSYCVIDVSAGPNATAYPVRYTFIPPEHTRGATNETCQLTEIWLKRINRGLYPFLGTDTNGGEGLYKVRFSKDFYICIFEITQRQWYQVTGQWPSQFSNELYRDARPVEYIYHDDILGHHNWPDNKTPTADSFVGRIRNRTGLTTFNLPTECQFEYAMRAGRTGSDCRPTGVAIEDFANFKRASCDAAAAAVADTTEGTLPVGSLIPNDWGLYDVCGNVREWLLDTYIAAEDDSNGNDLEHFYADEITANGYVLDPEGPPNATTGTYHPVTVWRHVVKGGYYANTESGYLAPYRRYEAYSKYNYQGCRCVVTCE